MKGIFMEPAQTSPVRGLTIWVRTAPDGRCDLTLHSYSDTGSARDKAKITAETPEEAVDWAWRYGEPIVGMVVRRGRASRDGEIQHGEHVIVVPDALTLAELAAMWLADDRPGEDAAMTQDPVPVTTLQDVWRWLREGLMKRLGDTDLHQAYLGASGDALFMEDGETGELTIVDCQEGEGLSIHVYGGDRAWELPTSGADPEVL